MKNQPLPFWQRTLNWLADKMIRKLKINNQNSKCEELVVHYYAQKPKFDKQYAIEQVRKRMAKLKKKIQKQKEASEKKPQSQLMKKITNKPMELDCPICMDLLIHATSTPCGHTFCFDCLDEALLTKNQCPVCRQNIYNPEMIRCQAIDHLIQNLIRSSEQQDPKTANESSFFLCAQSYKSRLSKFHNWYFQRCIPTNLRPTDMIDVLDTEHIWCRCTILQILTNQDKQATHILIHYIGWSSIYDEIISIHSNRLARYCFYTKRNSIPRYYLNHQYEDHLHGYVVVQPQDENLENQINQMPLYLDQEEVLSQENEEQNSDTSIFISQNSSQVDEETYYQRQNSFQFEEQIEKKSEIYRQKQIFKQSENEQDKISKANNEAQSVYKKIENNNNPESERLMI